MSFVPTMFLHFFLVAVLSSLTSGTITNFYSARNYTGRIQEVNSSAECINLPPKTHVLSYKTDTCTVWYEKSDCKSTETYRISPSNASASEGTVFPISSFHICNDDEGGFQLNLDITKHYDKDQPQIIPDVLQRYKRVCTCINIPKYVKEMDKWSINNHANHVRAYYEPNCLEEKVKSTFIWGGHTDATMDAYNLTQTDNVTSQQYKIQSIGPHMESPYFTSSCQYSTIISALTSKVNLLEKSLQQAEVRINANQNGLLNLNNELKTQVMELKKNYIVVERKLEYFEKHISKIKETQLNSSDGFTRKIALIESKLVEAEKITDDKIEKVKDEFKFLFQNKNN